MAAKPPCRPKVGKFKPPQPIYPTAVPTAVTQTVFPRLHSVPPMPHPPIFTPPMFSSNLYHLPFRTNIFGGLYPSRNITIFGTVLPAADMFTINLKCGNDIAFHLNPRFKEQAVVRNTHLNYSWGSEERGLPSFMPFIPGQPFSVQIVCEVHCLKVSVNGQHQFNYNHRVKNLRSINQLEVSGDILLAQVQIL